jgi:glycosyltransferase involved in cell wall biosynthesis
MSFSKNIFLVDPNQGGHHLTYLRLYSKTLLELGYKVVTLSPEPEMVRQWIKDNCSHYSGNFYAFAFFEPNMSSAKGLPQPLRVLRRWQHVKKTLDIVSSKLEMPVDLVILGWLDNYFSYYLPSLLIDLVFDYRWSGLYFFPAHVKHKNSKKSTKKLFLKKFLNHFSLVNSRLCLGIGVLDCSIAEYVQRKAKKTVLVFPDLTDEVTPDLGFPPVKEVLSRANGRTIVGLVGSLSKRKGLMTLLEVAKQSESKKFFFLFAGQLSESTLNGEEKLKLWNTVDSQPGNCFFYLDRIPEEDQFNALIHTCDILFAAYENFPYSSNLLTKAAAFGKPIIVSNGFCMSSRVEEFSLGATVSEGDVDECIDALSLLQNQLAISSEQWGFTTYHAKNSQERLSEVLKDLVALL